MRFQRVEVAGRASEVTISSEQIGTATGLVDRAAYKPSSTLSILAF